uniref:Uncharacterized protein n=1 Tax=Pithovirus LCDPAC02 TaxID=2506601 RepID=A0A481YQE8_9VIRU|nr:MAG: hypothetical protein LCDPAC02_03360 [Pithovirus LCDPAC02]
MEFFKPTNYKQEYNELRKYSFELFEYVKNREDLNEDIKDILTAEEIDFDSFDPSNILYIDKYYKRHICRISFIIIINNLRIRFNISRNNIHITSLLSRIQIQNGMQMIKQIIKIGESPCFDMKLKCDKIMFRIKQKIFKIIIDDITVIHKNVDYENFELNNVDTTLLNNLINIDF